MKGNQNLLWGRGQFKPVEKFKVVEDGGFASVTVGGQVSTELKHLVHQLVFVHLTNFQRNFPKKDIFGCMRDAFKQNKKILRNLVYGKLYVHVFVFYTRLR
jgi:hypothetical protein